MNSFDKEFESIISEKRRNNFTSCFVQRKRLELKLSQFLGDVNQDISKIELKYLEIIRSLLLCFNVYDNYIDIVNILPGIQKPKAFKDISKKIYLKNTKEKKRCLVKHDIESNDPKKKKDNK